jgi:hypothetical protein
MPVGAGGSGRRRSCRPRRTGRSCGWSAATSLRHRALGLRHPAGGPQRLVAGPLLDAALELCPGRRRCTSGVPNDPYDLADAPALTASRREPVRVGRALAVSAAAVTDHVGDSWYRRPPGRATVPRGTEPHAGLGERLHAICSLSRRKPMQNRCNVGCPLIVGDVNAPTARACAFVAAVLAARQGSRRPQTVVAA